jgi:L-fuculose-phosphate aldolase
MIKTKNDIVTICKRIYDKGWVSYHNGNVTAKLNNKIIATGSGFSKYDITCDRLVTLDLNGNKIDGNEKVFSEINLHLAIYNSRYNINSIIHTHAPYLTSFACSNIELNEPLIPETVIGLGDKIPLVSEKNGILALCDAILNYDTIMLENHGVISVGSDLFQAFYRMELAEHFAQIYFNTKIIGNYKTLSEEEINKLLDKRKTYGFVVPEKNKTTDVDINKLKEIITREVKNHLKL